MSSRHLCLLAARGESPTAFDRRCIPAVCVASRSNTAGIFPRRALNRPSAASITTGLGATRDFHHGLLGLHRRSAPACTGSHSIPARRHGVDRRSYGNRMAHVRARPRRRHDRLACRHRQRRRHGPVPGERELEKGRCVARRVTLFTGQWADLPLAELAGKARGFGFDGLELACWGDHFDVDRAAVDTTYCAERRSLLTDHKLGCWAILGLPRSRGRVSAFGHIVFCIPRRSPVVAVGNVRSTFSKGLVDALVASTGPAASRGAPRSVRSRRCCSKRRGDS